MAKNALKSYRKAQVNTATPAQRVVMMYEGLCKELAKGKVAIEEQDKDIKNIEIANNAINLASQIILELNLALDMELGGEISKNLRDLYEFWIQHLSEANTERDVQKVADVLTMAEEMRDTWREAAKKAKQQGLD